jgi:dipeptidase
MKYFFPIILLIAFSGSIVSQNDNSSNCYTIIVGKNASIDGSVMVGHNEDDKGDLTVNWFKVPVLNHKLNDSITLLSGKSYKQVKKTASYIRLQVMGEKFGDAYLNEHSVVICSNACASKEDTAIGFIGFDFRRILAEQAKSSREAVILGGKLIETFGYESSGRTYTIADKNEAWMLSVVKGKHWVAQRIPDSCVAIIPNYYTIQEINLSDSSNFLASPDLIDYAIKRGWHSSSQVFNFRNVYGDSATNCADYNVPRHLTGINALSQKKYNPHDIFPFSFIPKKKTEISDLNHILSSHYENDPEFDCSKGNPHECGTLPVCRLSTQFSFIAQLRSNLPDMIGALLWINPFNPCIFPSVPLYSGIFKTPENFGQNNWYRTDSLHFNKEESNLGSHPDHAYRLFQNYTRFIESNYKENMKENLIFKTKIENELKLNQIKFEKSVKTVYDSYPDDARKLLTHYCTGYIQTISDYYKSRIKQ